MSRCVRVLGQSLHGGSFREIPIHLASGVQESTSLRLVGVAHIHLDALRGLVPSPLGQLTLIVQLGIRDIARIPAAILFVSEDGGPKALKVVAGFGIDGLHLPQEKFLQHPRVESLRVLVDGLASHGKDGARLEAYGLRWAIVTEVVEEVFEVLCRRLQRSLALECPLWG